MGRKVPVTGDLLYMRDALNRSTVPDVPEIIFENPAAAKNLINLTQEFSNALVDPSYGLRFHFDEAKGGYQFDAIGNKRPLENVRHALSKLQRAALEAGLTELTLPVQQDGRYAKALRLNVLNQDGQLWSPADRPLLQDPAKEPQEPGPRVVFRFYQAIGFH